MNPTYAKLWALTVAVALIFCAYLFREEKEIANGLLSGAMFVAAGVGVGWQFLRRSGDVPEKALSPQTSEIRKARGDVTLTGDADDAGESTDEAT